MGSSGEPLVLSAQARNPVAPRSGVRFRRRDVPLRPRVPRRVPRPWSLAGALSLLLTEEEKQARYAERADAPQPPTALESALCSSCRPRACRRAPGHPRVSGESPETRSPDRGEGETCCYVSVKQGSWVPQRERDGCVDGREAPAFSHAEF